jgi:hypothetical protein
MFQQFLLECQKSPVAVYAAVVGTLSLVLTAMNWYRARPALWLDVCAPGAGFDQGLRYDSITMFAYNVGGTPVSITSYNLEVFDGVMALLRRKPSRTIQGNGRQLKATDYGLSEVIPGDAFPPYVVKSDAPKRLDLFAEAVWPDRQKRFVYLVVRHSHSRFALRKRLKPVDPWSYADDKSSAEAQLNMVSSLARQFAAQDQGREKLKRDRGVSKSA